MLSSKTIITSPSCSWLLASWSLSYSSISSPFDDLLSSGSVALPSSFFNFFDFAWFVPPVALRFLLLFEVSATVVSLCGVGDCCSFQVSFVWRFPATFWIGSPREWVRRSPGWPSLLDSVMVTLGAKSQKEVNLTHWAMVSRQIQSHRNQCPWPLWESHQDWERSCQKTLQDFRGW